MSEESESFKVERPRLQVGEVVNSLLSFSFDRKMGCHKISTSGTKILKFVQKAWCELVAKSEYAYTNIVRHPRLSIQHFEYSGRLSQLQLVYQ